MTGFNVRGLAINLLVDAALPFFVYQMLTGRGVATVPALLISGIFPAAWSVGGLVRARHLDYIGGLVLIGIAVSIVAALVGGNPKLLLIRESFVTGALGIVALASLLASRPLMFYFGRQMVTGMDPVRMTAFNASWELAPFRRLFRLLTIVWGVGWTGEFVLRVVLVSMLTVSQALAITPVVFNIITATLVLWTFSYSRQVRLRHTSSLAVAPAELTDAATLSAATVSAMASSALQVQEQSIAPRPAVADLVPPRNSIAGRRQRAHASR